MKELYVIGNFDQNGNLKHYVRKGRNNAISGYDSIGSAKRGLSQITYKEGCKVIKVTAIEVIE